MHSRSTGAPVLSRRASPTPTLSRRSSTRQSDESDDSDEEEHLAYAHVRRGSSSYHLLKLQHQSSSKQLDAAGVAPSSSSSSSSAAPGTPGPNAANAAYAQGTASRRSSLATGPPPTVGPSPLSFNADRRGSLTTTSGSSSRRSSLVTAATPRGSGPSPQYSQERRGSTSSSRRSSLVPEASGGGNGPAAMDATHGSTSRRTSLALDSVNEQGPAVSSTALPLPTLMTKLDAAVKQRPHFLKERSVTMVDRIPVQSSGDVHSRAGAFLLSLVDRSRHAGSVFDTKRAAFESRTPSAASDDSSLLPAGAARNTSGGPPAAALSRRRSVSSTPSAELLLLRPSDSRPTSGALSNRRQGLASARSLGLLLGASDQLNAAAAAAGSTHNDDDGGGDDDDQELWAPRSIVDLGRELALQSKSCAAQVVLLQELLRRLQDAEDDESAAQCRALVDDGLLPTVVAAMREFRFHAGLQLAAIALLSYVADVSELYALLMSDLDLEPLVQKVVAVHVSRERLVMMGSALHHALVEARSNARARQMRKAFDAERERKRAASVACVLSSTASNSSNGRAAEYARSSASDKERAARQRGAGNVGSVERAASEELHVHRPTLRLRRAKLGTPPVLDAHYQLDTRTRCTTIPPLRPQSTPALASPELWLEDGAMRPTTSPAELLLWRHPSDPSPLSVSRHEATAAAYAPSLLLPSKQRASDRRKRVARSSQRGGSRQRAEDERHERNNGESSPEQREHWEDEAVHNGEKKEEEGGGGEGEQAPEREDGEKEEEEEEEYEEEYEEDFAADDDASVASSRVMLTPAGSDGELLDLVLQTEPEGAALSSAEPTARKPLLPMDSDGELIDILQLQLDAEAQNDQEHTQEPQAAPAEDSEATDGSTPSETEALALETTDEKPPQRDQHTAEIVELLASCTLSPALNSSSSSASSCIAPQSTRTRRSKRATPSSSTTDAAPALWVRPVNKRVIDKTTPTGERVISAADSAEITSILRQIDAAPVALEPPFPPPSHATAVEDHLEDAVESSVKALEPPEPSQPHQPPEPQSQPSLSSPASPSRRTAHKRPQQQQQQQQRAGVLSDIQELYKRGLELHKANDLEPAIRCYQQAIRLQRSLPTGREFASLYINLGSAWMTQRRFTDALGAFQHAERIQPENCKAVFNTALALLMLGRQQEACKRFRRVLELDPTHGRARCALHAIDAPS